MVLGAVNRSLGSIFVDIYVPSSKKQRGTVFTIPPCQLYLVISNDYLLSGSSTSIDTMKVINSEDSIELVSTIRSRKARIGI